MVHLPKPQRKQSLVTEGLVRQTRRLIDNPLRAVKRYSMKQKVEQKGNALPL